MCLQYLLPIRTFSLSLIKKQIVLAKKKSNQTKNQKTQNRSQEAIRSKIGHPVNGINNGNQCDSAAADDSMEIVIVSDTVRQRRPRTPLQSPPLTPMHSSANTADTACTATELPIHCNDTKDTATQRTLPDLLPKTFHLAETCALFSQVDNAPNLLAQSSPKLTTPPPPPERRSSLLRRNSEHDYANVQKVSVVEIRAANLTTPKRAISTYHTRETLQSHNIGQVMNMCSILESIDYIEPCQVETVHIVDVTSEPSDSETCGSTPSRIKRTKQNSQRKSSSDDDDDDENDDQSDANEYETGEPKPKSARADRMKILRQMSYERDGRALPQDRDLLKDSEIEIVPERRSESMADKPHRIKLTPTLKEILSATSRDYDRNAATADAYDEPLVFSDDDDDDADTVDRVCCYNKPIGDQVNRDTVFFLQIELNETH